MKLRLKRIATAVFFAVVFIFGISSCKDSPSKSICLLKESGSIHVADRVLYYTPDSSQKISRIELEALANLSEFYSIAWNTPTCIEN